MEFIRHQLKRKDFYLNLLIYICLFLFCLYPYRDYDWGWHYRQGEYFVTHGHIMFHDIFSWTMTGYTWINHEWLYDPLIYVLFNTVSFWGLSLSGAVVSFLAFYFGVKGYKLKPYALAICAFLFGYLVSGVIWQGLRSQLIGLLFIALIMYWLRLIDRGKQKFLLLIPPFFLLWANLHGTFTFGILIFGLYVFQKICIDTFQEGKIYISKSMLYLALSFLVSAGVTFINPFGIGVYEEAYRHFHNPLLKYIGEWDPVAFPSTFYALMIIYAVFTSWILFSKYRKTKKINLYEVGIILFTFFLAWGARRYVAVAIVATLPFFASYLASIRINLDRFKAVNFLLILAIVVSLEIGLFNRIIPWKIFQGYSYESYCNLGSNCSEGLTAYLMKHPPKGHGFNFYDWGGYLIGRGVPAKLFIDGRMHLWTNPSGYQPFWDYQRIYYDGNTKLFDTYNLDWILVPQNSSIQAYVLLKKIKGTWIQKYADNRAVYYVRER